MKEMEHSVVKRVRAYCLETGALRAGESVLCALSGGPDSCALFHILLCLADEFPLATVEACHVEHGIRQESSVQDMAFVQKLCQEKGVVLHTLRCDIPAIAKKEGRGLEAVAREQRHAFFMETLAKRNLDACALGHHEGDQAETVLMHLARGARGLVGIKARSGQLARPLLCLSRREIMDFLQQEGLDFCIDATNDVPDNPRNALRASVLPQMQAHYPGATAAIARAAAFALSDEELLAHMAAQWLAKHERAGALYYEELPPEPVLRRALALFVQEADAPLSAPLLKRLCHLAQAPIGTRVQANGRAVERSHSGLLLVSQANVGGDGREVPLALPGRSPMSTGYFAAEAWQGAVPLEEAQWNRQFFDADALAGCVARYRRQGDRMHKLGAAGSKKLKDILIDTKVPRAMRENVPLLAKEEQVLWAVGVGIAQQVRVGPHTQRVVRLCWHDQK